VANPPPGHAVPPKLADLTACICVPVERPLWRDRPSWFLVAEEDRMIPAETQRFMADRMKARVHTAACDHVQRTQNRTCS
jgi:pimeloyl-ACP methyl ester carboxylesterase